MSYQDSPAGRAADALCDLNTASAIILLCEGGLFRTAAGGRFSKRIVKLCDAHAQQQLRAHDKARAALAQGKVA